MRLPLTLHPANHLPAQCLLLHAALHADDPPSSHTAGKKACYRIIEELARCPTAYTAWGPRHSFLPPQMAALARWAQTHAQYSTAGAARLSAPPEELAPTSPASPRSGASIPCYTCASAAAAAATPATGATHDALSRLPPPALIARYGPRVLVRELQQRHTDPVPYDAAVHHAALLAAMLQPYGLQVATTGITRRGAPLALHAELLLCLSKAATRAVQAAHPDNSDLCDIAEAAEDDAENASAVDESVKTALQAHGSVRSEDAVCEARGGQMPTSPTPPRSPLALSTMTTTAPRRSHAFLQDDLMIRPARTAPPQEPVRGAAPGAPSSTRDADTARAPTPHTSASCASSTPPPPSASARLKESLPRQLQHRCDAFSSHDTALTAPVCFRIRRAMAELVRAGFVVGAVNKAFPPSQVKLRNRRVFSVVVRYDPHRPTQVPQPHCTDAATLARLQLHVLRLRFCPCDAFHARQLFCTGPAAFTAHVTLQALARGVDVNVNGVFSAKAPAGTDVASHGGGGDGDHDGKKGLAGAVEMPSSTQCGSSRSTTAAQPQFGLPTGPSAAHAPSVMSLQPAAAAADETAMDCYGAAVTSATSRSPPPPPPPPTSPAAATPTRKSEAADRSLVEQLMVESEDDIMTLAGIPHVDAALRGLYCQKNNL